MGLTQEQIDKLYQKKTQPKPVTKIRRNKLGRIRTQYATLPKGGPVVLDNEGTSFRCASRGCSSPTYYKFRGIPYCMTHLIVYLTMELHGNHNGSGPLGSNGGTGGSGTIESFEGRLTSEGTL